MDSLQQSDQEISTSMRDLEDSVGLVRGAALMPEKKQLEKVSRAKWKSVRSLVSAFKAEVGRCENATQKVVFNRNWVQYNIKIGSIDKELRDLLNPPKERKPDAGANRDTALMGEGGEDGSGFGSTAQVYAAGVRIQDDAMRSLQRSERLALNAEETGRETLNVLQKQTEVLYRIDDELTNLQGNLDRAKMEVMWFARQLAGDKCFTMVFLFVVLAVCGVVFWKIRKGRSKTTTPAPATIIIVPPPATAAQAVFQMLLNELNNE